MFHARSVSWARGLAIGLAAVLVFSSRLSAAEPAAAKSGDDDTATVDMFDAMKSGDLDVKIFLRNSHEGQVIIKNNTNQPLNVHLPEAFAAVPVLAQAAGAGGQKSYNNNNKQNQNQGAGGGMGGGGGGGMGGGAFNIAAERTVKLKVPVVCLDYGKEEPNAHIPYEIRPIESYCSVPEVKELCVLLGDKKTDQHIAQAAAWHFANQMSWDQLADLKSFPHLPALTKPYFSAADIQAALMVADQARKAADAHKAAEPAAKPAAQADSASAPTAK